MRKIKGDGEKLWENMKCSKLMKEGLISLFIALITSIFAGLFLEGSKEMLLALPGLIALIPAANDMRGNIFGALSSRLGSALHLGSIKNFDIRNKVIRSNIHSSISITLLFSFFLGFFTKIFCYLFGIESMPLLSFILVSLIGGVISGLILLVITFIISIKSYQLNLDPDNITSPLITALGDFFTIPSLILAAYIVINIPWKEWAFFVFATIIIIDIFIIIRKKSLTRKIVIQSIPVLFISFFITIFSGLFLEANIEKLMLIPGFLILFPAFLEETGNICNIFASRMSTRLHMGSVEAEFKTTKKINRDIITLLKLSILIFFALSAIIYVYNYIYTMKIIDSVKISSSVLFAGLAVVVICIILSFIISIFSYKQKVDPDNVVIPIMTSVADFICVVILIGVLHILLVI